MYQIKWLLDRWRIMQHPYEELYRMKQQMQYHLKDKIWAVNLPLSLHFIFKPSIKQNYLVNDLKEIVESSFGDMKKYKLLNVVIEDIVSNNYWNYDAKNKKICKCKFVHKINDFDYSQGEVKYVYELSRLYQLAPLAAFYITTNDKQGICRLKSSLKEWYKQNPFLYNVAWKSGNVVGIRAVNLIIFKCLLDLVDEDEKFTSFFNELMELHYKYLKSHLSLYSSKGNHHIGELSGLIAICSSFEFKNSKEILKTYFNEMQSEVLRLIYTDGFNKEQATRYQASYINLFMMAFSFAKGAGLNCNTEVEERMANMYLFLYNFKIKDNSFFQVGDDDDAQLIYPYSDTSYNIYESMLNDNGLLFNGKLNENYHFDFRNYVLLGKEKYKKYKDSSKEKYHVKESAILYKESGYYLLSNNKIHLLLDVGRMGLLPSMSHGHSDILGFLLYYNQIPVIVDPGSYQYNIKYKKIRDYFHGVHAHNTISVGGEEQANSSSGMFWLSNPKVIIEKYSINLSNPYCEAFHEGYIRNEMNIIHRRKIRQIREERKIIIEDELEGNGASFAYFYLHFHSNIKLEQRNSTLFITNDDIPITISNPLFIDGEIYKGNKERPLGWYSPSYDNIIPCFSFTLKIDLNKNKTIETIINYK